MKIEGCDFSKREFEHFNFSNKNLKDINFTKANLFGAIFNKTKLKNVNFKESNLFGAYFVEAKLVNVNFKQADISSSDFTGALINSIDFSKATREDVTWGEMTIEKPDILQIKNCKLLINNEMKSTWAATIALLAIKGADDPSNFILNNLCKWHPNGDFILENITDIDSKEKILISDNSCVFPVFVWFKSNRIHIEDRYNLACKKKSRGFSSSPYNIEQLKKYECSFSCRGAAIWYEQERQQTATISANTSSEAAQGIREKYKKFCNDNFGYHSGQTKGAHVSYPSCRQIY